MKAAYIFSALATSCAVATAQSTITCEGCPSTTASVNDLVTRSNVAVPTPCTADALTIVSMSGSTTGTPGAGSGTGGSPEEVPAGSGAGSVAGGIGAAAAAALVAAFIV